MMKYKYVVFMLLLSFLFVSPGFAQFGKNKIQYKNFKWYFIQSNHFDIYYYPGGEKLAQFTAEVAEEAYEQLKRDFSYDIKQRLVFIIYNSHNDWQQTNVVLSYLEEGIGGVTELYKNRIVVPFEGSYEQFRHVIHHELVHGVMNDLLYGGSVQSLIVGEVLPVPLWVAEGLAEFESTGWSTHTDMIVRDAVLTDYIPPVQYLEYILVYQGGNALFRYVAETYGREKIGELLLKARGNVAFQQVLVSAIGLDHEGLTERWHRYLQKIYSPEVNQREIPKEFSEQLTDHNKLKNFINLSPAITPQGDKVAYISDRSGYQNIYLMSAIDGKEIRTLVKGQRSESFEELHLLRPGMSFSPDGKKLSFAAKSGEWDAIYILDINNGRIEKHVLKTEGAFTTSWSPDGKKIAFVANEDEKSDIYIFDLETGVIKAITSDVFTDDQPSWSPDGKYIAFVSDRNDYLSDEELPEDFQMSKWDYEFRDIYIVEWETGKIRRITNTPWEEGYPVFSPDGNKLAYISDESGIFNIYLQDLNNGDYFPITNIISGVMQIDWDKDADKLVYSTFYNGGYDIYLINNPLTLEPKSLELTLYAQERRETEAPVYARNWQPDKIEKKSPAEDNSATLGGSQPADYSNYVFGRSSSSNRQKPAKNVIIPDYKVKDEFGNYKARKYKIKFSPDIVTGAAGYNTFFGFQGYTTFVFSDLLGDHQIFLNAALWTDLRNSDFTLMYMYLKRRINFGIGGFHLVYLLQDYFSLLRYRNFGFNFIASYPLNRFDRLDFIFLWYNVYLEYLDFNFPVNKVSALIPEIQFVHDNVLWGFRWGVYSPVSGSRYNIVFRGSPKFSDIQVEFRTIKFDYRKYFMLSPQYQLAFRVTAGASFGKNAQQFFLGGMDNWINPAYRTGKRIGNIEDVFFSEFVTPLRGAFYYERTGNRFFLINNEFRFPLVQYLKLGFPPISLFNVSGVAFYDIGAAWDNTGEWYDLKGFNATIRDPNGNRIFDDIISGYGFGARIYFLGFLVRFDVAWPYDFNRTYDQIYYWSLGLNF
jgi:Tol biopolymer transport system component